MASTEHMRAHHSLRSEQKREAVLHAARAMIRSGIEIEWATLARRAGVSEKFIHDKKHADVKSQVTGMIATQAGHQAERASHRALELERRVGELQTLLDERDREVLALRDSLRKTIRERNTGT